jgi:hypothetical protein
MQQYSVAIKTFNQVFDVAWQWAQKDQLLSDVKSILAAYETARTASHDHETDCHAIPEIAAAVQSFIMSREAIPGMYVYFDVGGGTVDGVGISFGSLYHCRLAKCRPGAWLLSPYTGWPCAKWPNGEVGWLPADVALPDNSRTCMDCGERGQRGLGNLPANSGLLN